MRARSGRLGISKIYCRGALEPSADIAWLNLIDKLEKNKCVHCPREFLTRDDLNNHFNAEHSPENPLKCDYCATGFCKDLASLEEHLKFHGHVPTPGSHFCLECLKVF